MFKLRSGVFINVRKAPADGWKAGAFTLYLTEHETLLENEEVFNLMALDTRYHTVPDWVNGRVSSETNCIEHKGWQALASPGDLVYLD